MLKDILSISGHSGLYKYLKKSRNGIIIEHLETRKRMNADPSLRINSLEDISIYTQEGDIKLKEVFKKIYEKENGGKALNPKKAKGDALKQYFAEVIPAYDDERVYNSDIKKILSWYNTLHKLSMLNRENLEDEKEDEEQEKQDPPADDSSLTDENSTE